MTRYVLQILYSDGEQTLRTNVVADDAIVRATLPLVSAGRTYNISVMSQRGTISSALTDVITVVVGNGGAQGGKRCVCVIVRLNFDCRRNHKEDVPNVIGMFVSSVYVSVFS